jgi:hypothetical protein
MDSKIKYSLISAVFLTLSGCAAVTESGYYWGGYSETYYDYIKNPSEQTLNRHVEELYKIVDYSQKKNLKVPPGIFAELGFIKAKLGADQESIAFYRQESALYPESQPFIERLIADSKKGTL